MKLLIATVSLLTSFSSRADMINFAAVGKIIYGPAVYTCSYEYIANGAQVIVTRQSNGFYDDGSYVACTDAQTACQNQVKNKKPAVKCKFFIKGVVKK